MYNTKDNEIDLVEILKKIYKSKKYILLISISFAIIGVAISILSPVRYSSETIFIPQNQESKTSSLSNVASLVGINLGCIILVVKSLLNVSSKFKVQNSKDYS
jgi:LPS O-antigen subunit length determinant protein (WzzB/FepE family)